MTGKKRRRSASAGSARKYEPVKLQKYEPVKLQKYEPEKLVADPDAYMKKWVAVGKGGVVLAAATSRLELAEKVRRQHLKPSSFVARYIDEPPGGTVIGLG